MSDTHLVHIMLKGNPNPITLEVEDFDWVNEGPDLTKIKWEQSEDSWPRLGFIDPREIAVILVEKSEPFNLPE